MAHALSRVDTMKTFTYEQPVYLDLKLRIAVVPPAESNTTVNRVQCRS